ncbi:MAG: winged helix-turn-helix domain-containing protein [Bacteroidota bacterium]
MRSLQVAAHFSNADLQKNLSLSRNSPGHSRWQIIYLIQVGKMSSAELIAPLVNLSVHSIYKIVEHYNHSGVAALGYKKKGGRRRSLLSLSEEAALFSSLETMALKGLIKTANDIRVVVERKTGKVVSDDYLWDLLHRNGWKKKMPRPHHPKRSNEEQEDFKKNSPKSWTPPQ